MLEHLQEPQAGTTRAERSGSFCLSERLQTLNQEGKHQIWLISPSK